MATATERMRRWRERNRTERGLKTVTVEVPHHLEPELRLIAQALRSNPGLTFGPLKDSASGRLVKVKI
jgi:hypothetical protein